MNKTNVIGYFNANDYPLNLSIAEFNIIINLKPKAYIIDRNGKLVNDPVLNTYVRKGCLSRASDKKQTVDIVRLCAVNPPPVPGKPAQDHVHSVSQAVGFETKNGNVQPVRPKQEVAVPVPRQIASNPVRGYTMEEAKRLHLIKPTRAVPEDYGAEETTGAPKSGREIPPILVATDTVRSHKPPPLPAELAQPLTPEQQAIMTTLQTAARTNPDSENLLTEVTRDVVNTVQETQAPAQVVTAFPKPNLTSAPTAPPIPTHPEPTTMTFPAPVLDETTAEAPVQEETNQLVVETELDPGEGALPITCSLCPPDKTFKNVGLLKRHARRFHPDTADAIVAPYES